MQAAFNAISGEIERIGSPDATLQMKGPAAVENESRLLKDTAYMTAMRAPIDCVERRSQSHTLIGARRRFEH